MNIRNLSNGIRVCFIPSLSRTIGVDFICKAGASYGTPGLAHFVEHTVLCATEKYPNFIALASVLDNLGLYRNAYTSHENMSFVFRALPEHLDPICEFLSQVVIQPLFLENDIEKQRKIITQEIKKAQSDALISARNSLLAQAYGARGPGVPVLGTEKDVVQIERGDLVAFFKTQFVSENCFLTIAGDIDEDRTIVLLEKTLALMPKGNGTTTSLEAVPMSSPIRKEYPRQGITQATLMVTWESCSMNDQKKYAFRLLRILLTEGRLSRLWQTLRQNKALVYSTTSRLVRYENFGNFTIVTGLDQINIELALYEILKEIQLIAENGISDLDLERAKNLAKTNTLFEVDSTLDLAEYYAAKVAFEKEPKTLEEEIQIYGSVSKESVKQIAQGLVASQPHILVYKPA